MIEKFINKMKTEGVDHIRIHPFANTFIGKVTSQDWRFKFFVPHVGEFTSPVCFANWICTGDDEARHNVQFRCEKTVKGFLPLVLYAKYYQLCAMRNVLKREMVDLPFVAYKVHASGIKEFDRWKEYPSEIKLMIEHILDPERGTKVDYPWEETHPGLVDRINKMIKDIVGEQPEQPVQPRRKGKNKPENVDAVEETNNEELVSEDAMDEPPTLQEETTLEVEAVVSPVEVEQVEVKQAA
jgi:hypothetical protein